MKTQNVILYVFLSLGFFSVSIHNLYAQQEPQYTQYMYNPMSINPAYVGSRNTLNILSLYRTQWVGLDGAPQTLNLGIHSPIGVSPVGVGLGFTSDKIGPSSQSVVESDFSYTISITRNTQLAFGVRAGMSLLSVDPNKLLIYDPNDHNLELKDYQSPIIGTGLYLFTDNWYIGFSTPNLLETKYYNDVQVSTATRKNHIYLMGGYVLHINPYLQLKPAFMMKHVSGAPLSLDLSANTLINEKVTLGLGYRLNASMSALAGFQVNESILIGYAYDYETTELSHHTSGSHEIFMRFELKTRKCPLVRPRFY